MICSKTKQRRWTEERNTFIAEDRRGRRQVRSCPVAPAPGECTVRPRRAVTTPSGQLRCRWWLSADEDTDTGHWHAAGRATRALPLWDRVGRSLTQLHVHLPRCLETAFSAFGPGKRAALSTQNPCTSVRSSFTHSSPSLKPTYVFPKRRAVKPL